MDKSSLVYPMFVMDGENKNEEIPTMPGQFRYTLDRMPEALNELADAGVGSVMLFGIPEHKDEWEAVPMPATVSFRELWRRQRRKFQICIT